MRRSTVTSASIVGSITAFGVAVGLLTIANHPELPPGYIIGGTSLFAFSLSVLLVTIMRAAGRPMLRIAGKVVDVNPRSATEAITLAYQVDGLACTLHLPRAAFVSLPRADSFVDFIMLGHDEPFADVAGRREFGPPDKPSAFGEV